MNIIHLITLLSLGSLASVALANQETQSMPTTSSLELTQEETAKAPQGILPFLAAGGGYTGYENLSQTESSPATLKLLGSYYFESPTVVDLGFGVNNQQFIQATGAQETATTGGVAELALRYRWDNRWQAGIVGNQFYEQGRNLSADQGDAHFVGLQVLKEFNITQSWLARIGARAMSLTNNTDGLVAMYLVDLQIGWNPGAYRPSVRQVSETTNPVQREFARPETQTPAAPPVALRQEARTELKDVAYSNLRSNEGVIQFPTSAVALSNSDQQKLSRVAKALNENSDLFERVEIRGYADASGSSILNERLSQQRAEQVRSVLRKNGLSSASVVAKGMGSRDSTGSMAADRRAEIVFVGVKDEEKLREVLAEIE